MSAPHLTESLKQLQISDLETFSFLIFDVFQPQKAYMFSFQKNILVFVCFTFVCFDIHNDALRRQFHTIQKSY